MKRPEKKRIIKPCPCKYQKEGKWGYGILRWNSDKWKPMRSAATVGVTEVLARPYETVLITCLGCGNDVLREFPPVNKGGS